MIAETEHQGIPVVQKPGRTELLLHLDDRYISAVHGKFQSGVTAGKSAAGDDDLLSCDLFRMKVGIADLDCIFDSRYVRQEGRRAGRQDDPVLNLQFRGLRGDECIHLKHNSGFFTLEDLPVNECFQAVFEHGSACSDKLSAEDIVSFKQGYMMSLDGGNPRRFEPAGTSADHSNSFRRICFFQGVVALRHGHCIDCASDLAVFIESSDTDLIAEETRPDVFTPCFQEFVRKIRIRDQRTPHHNIVDLALLQSLFCTFRRVIARAQNSHIAGLFDFRRIIHHTGISLIDGRNDPLLILVAPHIDVEGVYAQFFHIVYDLDRLFESTSAVKVVVCGHAHQDRVIRPYGRPHRLVDFFYNAHPFFKGAAIFVGALVPGRSHKLIQDIAAVRMDFNGVRLGDDRALCRPSESCYQFVDLIDRKCTAEFVREIEGGDFAGAYHLGV